LVPVSISAISSNGFDVIMPLLGGAVYGQCGASLAIGILQKDKEKKRIAFQSAFSCALGVTEPALFGVTVPNPKAMLCACIGGAAGGMVAGIAGAHCTSFAFPSIITCVAYAGPGFAGFLISMAVGLVVSFPLTLLVMRGSLKKGK
ncbi:MAG: protein-L-isoaspartate O-methyltransferase, partial [Lachnospiraceae bacterium]|nr:protein-L-isoaspartate O-methyltransferase [Lachnospiraceae bacterium]